MYLSPPITYYSTRQYPRPTPIDEYYQTKKVYNSDVDSQNPPYLQQRNAQGRHPYYHPQELNYAQRNQPEPDYPNYITSPGYPSRNRSFQQHQQQPPQLHNQEPSVPVEPIQNYNQLKDQDIRLLAYYYNEEVTFRKEIAQLSKRLRTLEPNLLQLFQMFSEPGSYKIEKFRFVEILQSYQDGVKVCDVDLLFKQLNHWKQAQSITFSQFCHLLCRYAKYDDFGDINDLKYQQDIAPQEQINLMMRILQMNLQLHSSVEYMRQRIEKSMSNLTQLFEFVDRDKNGLIKPFELCQFLQQLGYYVTTEEMALILADIDERAQINIQQFVFYLKPKSAAVYL